MSKESSLFSGLLVFGICVPLALFLGYLLATPLEATSMVWIALTLFLLLSPILLQWHHETLIIRTSPRWRFFFRIATNVRDSGKKVKPNIGGNGNSWTVWPSAQRLAVPAPSRGVKKVTSMIFARVTS
jgi:hypothetical protein